MLRPEHKIVSQQMEPNLWPSLLLHSHSKKGLVFLSQVIFLKKYKYQTCTAMEMFEVSNVLIVYKLQLPHIT